MNTCQCSQRHDATVALFAVASFSLQDKMCRLFDLSLGPGIKHADKANLAAGVFFGFSLFIMFAANATCFWAGAKFISMEYDTLC